LIPLVTLVGIDGVGKDTIGAALANCFHDAGCAAETGAFAAPLKRMCGEIWGIPGDVLYGPTERRGAAVALDVWDSNFAQDWCRILFPGSDAAAYDHFCKVVGDIPHYLDTVTHTERVATARDILRFIGTEWGRVLDHDIWAVKALKDAKAAMMKSSGAVVITDGRFDNETMLTRCAGGIAIRLRRDGVVPKSDHISATWAHNAPDWAFDATVWNDYYPHVVAKKIFDQIIHYPLTITGSSR
jgi:hypothetical protein